VLFHATLIVVLVVFVAVALRRGLDGQSAAELGLTYLLVGYCGVPMVVVAIVSLVHPHEAAEVLGFTPENPFQTFLSWALLGMALAALLSFKYRGRYLIGPAVVWATFFAGATHVHLTDLAGRGGVGHGSVVAIFLSHGLISLLLMVALVRSGVLVAPKPPSA